VNNIFLFDFEYNNVQLFYLQLPAIEVVSKLPPVDRDLKRPPISVVVVCPTRELADQAAAEANKLLKFHPSIGVQLVIGGTRMALEQKRMHTNPCQVIQIILLNNPAKSVVICSVF
jgi:superfamily II DNA/RNA helicase